jgi:hypothetical protein
MRRSLPRVLLLLAAVVLAGCSSLSTPSGTKKSTPTVTTSPKTSPVAPTSTWTPTIMPTAVVSASVTSAPTEVVGGGTPVTDTVSSGTMDYIALLANLRVSGVALQAGGRISSSVLSGNGHIIRVNNAEVQVFEYSDPTAANAEAARISADGSKVGKAKVNWAAPPHIFKQGRLLVIYAGTDTQITAVLQTILGPQVAGAQDGATAKPAGQCTDKARMTQDVTIYFVGEHAILDRARQHHAANA